MKNLVVVALLVSLLSAAAHAAEPKRLLLVTTTSGFRHAAVPIQEQMIRDMARSSGEFTIVSTSDSPDFPAAEYKATVDARNARIPRENAPDNRADLVAARGGGGGRGAAGFNLPGATPAQQAAMTAMNTAVAAALQAATDARTALNAAAFSATRDSAAIAAKAGELAAAELALARARAEQFERIQATADKLTAAQTQSLVQNAGGRAAGGGGRGAGAAPAPGGMTTAERVAKVLAQYLSAEALKNYDAVAFLSTTGELPLPDKDAFFKWVADGHGFIGLHSATDTLHNLPEYIAMVGAEFAGHGAHSVVSAVNADPASPLTAGWGASMRITEEWYTFRNYDRSQVHVLLAMETHPTSGAPAHVPISWIKMHGKGRVFYSSLGHRDDVLDPKADIGDAEFKVRYNGPEVATAVQRHLREGIRWSLGLIEADATPGTR